MLSELTHKSKIEISRIKTGIMIEVDSPDAEEIPSIFGISFNIDTHLEAWACLMEWFVVDEIQLQYVGDNVSRNTSLTFIELTDLVASAWSINDLMRVGGDHAEYILSLMNKCSLIK